MIDPGRYTKDVGTLNEVVEHARLGINRAKYALHAARARWLAYRPPWHDEITKRPLQKIRMGQVAREALETWQEAESAYNHAAEWLARWQTRLAWNPQSADVIVSRPMVSEWDRVRPEREPGEDDWDGLPEMLAEAKSE